MPVAIILLGNTHQNVQKSGLDILKTESDDALYVHKSSRSIVFTFRTDDNNSQLELKSFWLFPRPIEPFASALCYCYSCIDVGCVRRDDPPVLRLHGNVHLLEPINEVQYAYLLSDGPPSRSECNQGAPSTSQIVSNRNIQYLVPNAYPILHPRPEIGRRTYRDHFNDIRDFNNRNRECESLQ